MKTSCCLIDYSEATQKDKLLSQSLELFLRGKNLYETQEETLKREKVLEQLSEIVKEWCFQTCRNKGLSVEESKAAGGKIFTFGSYRLGVHGCGSDIDVVCVVPKFIDRKKDFFGDLVTILNSRKDIQKVTPISSAKVPIIKLIFEEIHIDLLCAKLTYEKLEEELISLQGDDIILKCETEEDRKSLNGARVNDLILSLVPNIQNFRLTLIAVKYWAKQRGLYSMVLGLLGGIA